ncbi:MAG: gliding motility protein GldL [Dysgonamonadaceae bacterium]|jgi:gliding motility-associated protein GldL|nr:gliding motility protein GldL [Dysgonamonadaceae bacterium]
MGLKRKYQNTVEKFLSGDAGKRFFQVFYSMGAAVVIIGALAKITHWPYNLGNILLTTGLLTEFFVFLLSAFDSPVKDYQWERVFPVLDTNDANDRPTFGNGVAAAGSVVVGSGIGSPAGVKGAGVAAGGAVIIGGANFGGGTVAAAEKPKSAAEKVEEITPEQGRRSFGIPNAAEISRENANAPIAGTQKTAAAADHLGKMDMAVDVTQQYMDKLTEMSDSISKFSAVTNSLTDVSDDISRSSRGYAHQMETLNRNIQGLNTIYEIQLKGISSQIDAIERINSGLMRIKDLYEGSITDSSVFRSETEKMAQQLHALNGVYNRLLNAMTMNMYGTGSNPYVNNPQAGFNPNPNMPA